MPAYLTKEQKEAIFSQYGKNSNDTGSVEGQVALFTHRIKSLAAHLNENNKDHSSRRSLLRLVGKRRRLLAYLQQKDINRYREIIQQLGIRK